MPASSADEVADRLRAAIDASEYRPGHQLPSRSVLAERYGVSTPTVQTAFNTLVSEGLVTTRRGAGVFVRQPSETITLDEALAGFDAPEETSGVAPGWVLGILGLSSDTVITIRQQVLGERLHTEWEPRGERRKRPTHRTITVQARAAGPDEREALGLRAGTPVLAYLCYHRAADDRITRIERTTIVGAAYVVDLTSHG